MTATGETSEDHGDTRQDHGDTREGHGATVRGHGETGEGQGNAGGSYGGTGSAGRQPASPSPVSDQQRALRVLAELLDRAAAQNLPAIDWRLAAFEARLIGRCTAFPGPGRRRADFEAWRAVLGADATEEHADGQPARLIAQAERDNGRVTIEIVADLYDDIPATPGIPPNGNWRTP